MQQKNYKHASDMMAFWQTNAELSDKKLHYKNTSL